MKRLQQFIPGQTPTTPTAFGVSDCQRYPDEDILLGLAQFYNRNSNLLTLKAFQQ